MSRKYKQEMSEAALFIALLEKRLSIAERMLTDAWSMFTRRDPVFGTAGLQVLESTLRHSMEGAGDARTVAHMYGKGLAQVARETALRDKTKSMKRKGRKA